MANKFVLIPEDIYKGLISSPVSNTGDSNLEFSQKTLENVKNLKLDSEKKNILYNQELQRYRHLRKEHEEKPVRVLIANQQETQAPHNLVPQASTNNKTSKRARRSRAPSPEETPPPKKRARLGTATGFAPSLWN
jgi:hypothetical protein